MARCLLSELYIQSFRTTIEKLTPNGIYFVLPVLETVPHILIVDDFLGNAIS